MEKTQEYKETCFLIVAAGSAIGQAVSTLLRAQGYTVLTAARTASRITPDFLLDAADFDAVDATVGAAKARLGHLDGVVNCAGSLLLKPAHLTSFEQYQAVITASLTTAFAVTRACGKHMTTGGSLVLISSAAALDGFANHEAIAAAKAGIIGLALAAAASYAPQKLRVNVVAPGLVETPLTAQLTGNPTARKISEQMHPLGRLGLSEDIARAIVFLLTPDNDWITGQVLAVDGGLSRVRGKIKA